DGGKEWELDRVGQASGVSLPLVQRLLQVLLGAHAPSVSQLGRYTRAAADQAGVFLRVLDHYSRPLAQAVAADEVFAGRRPILMVVAQDSWCWLNGRLAPSRAGEQWAQEFRTLPHLRLVTKDGGSGMSKGLAILCAERQQTVPAPTEPVRHGNPVLAGEVVPVQPPPAEALPAIAEQDDHFHVFREGHRALRRQQGEVARA